MPRKQETAQGEAQGERRRPSRFRKALMRPMVVILAAFPYPLWW